jgi:hypothetical protein
MTTNIYKFDTNKVFPDFIKIDLCNELIVKINNLIKKYKDNTKDAVIYSLIENKTIKSDRRVSHKSSFHDEDLKKIIDTDICPLIYSIISVSEPNTLFNVSIGPQSFDYISYNNGGYFDMHKDFVRINNSSHQQYTLLIGLTLDKYNYSGSTMLWFPVNESNQSDYDILTNDKFNSSDPTCKKILEKYNLPSSKEKIKEIFNRNNENKYIPYTINCMHSGKSLLFRSDILHSGEEFHSWHAAKELFMLTINITAIEKKENTMDKLDMWLNDTSSKIILFDKFDIYMLEFVEKYKLIPFQIVVSSGEYNNKKFSDTYIKYFSFLNTINETNTSNILERINTTLIDIYDKTKTKLNTRGRESHIESIVLESSTIDDKISNLNGVNFNVSHISSIDLIAINNYVNNFVLTNNNIVTHTEKINNTWEESGCNDDGDEYDEITYLNCHIDIKFCFLKML